MTPVFQSRLYVRNFVSANDFVIVVASHCLYSAAANCFCSHTIAYPCCCRLIFLDNVVAYSLDWMWTYILKLWIALSILSWIYIRHRVRFLHITKPHHTWFHIGILLQVQEIDRRILPHEREVCAYREILHDRAHSTRLLICFVTEQRVV